MSNSFCDMIHLENLVAVRGVLLGHYRKTRGFFRRDESHYLPKDRRRKINNFFKRVTIPRSNISGRRKDDDH